MISEQNRSTNVMVVDDTIANLKLLEGILGRRGYRVRSFPRGRLALAAAALEPPDLILLDINIPEMNGYEMCARLKANPALAPIPVIFISALNESWDKVKAFGCGGVDYINKPFNIEEIIARVENHVNLRRLQTQLEHHNQRLDESVQMKTRELAEANERLMILDKAKNDFMMLISHELRTPLHDLSGVAEMLLASFPAHAANSELIDIFRQSQARLLRIIEDALLLTQIQAGVDRFTPALFPLTPLVRQALEQVAAQARQHGVALPAAPADLPLATGHAKLMQRAFVAVAETAIKFSSEGCAVEMSCRSEGCDVLVTLVAWGRMIPEHLLPQFFEVLASGQPVAPGGELGLSLPLARRIFTLFGGGITVENQVPAGIKLQVHFRGIPAAEAGGTA